ncbi:hypothetical protein KC19_4G065600 [Ceratodon purpureus]|uniref:Uncharacterized protein n=1 Tax=Ceratodon purpureus TaxID=3225 RepID=A0A8T0I7N7_CERPU|nr:hypothetical protein KC19_4G065600 [Ceratodon purpureus]
MVGESGTQSDYDDEWEKLLDSGILEDLIKKAEVENAVKQATQADFPDSQILESLVQKAEQESAVKRASQVVPSFSTPQSRPGLVPPPVLPGDAHIPSLQPSCVISTSAPFPNAAQISGRAQVQSENTFNTRSQVLHGPGLAKPPLPFDLRGSQSYNQDRFENPHTHINLSQYPTQTPRTFGYNPTPVNGAVSTPNQLSNGVSGFGRDGEVSQLRTRLLKADSELNELRKRVAAQASSQHVPQFQQKELERLSLELSFKDQEVLEARRARDEKDDRLRDAQASVAALKEELQFLQRLRKADAAGTKRYREEGAVEAAVRAGPSYSQDDESDEFFAACSDRLLEVTNAHAKAQFKKLDQGQDTLRETEKPRHVAAHKAVTPKETSDANVLKARTVNDGCVTSDQKKSKVSPLQASEVPGSEHTPGGNGASAPAPQQVIPSRGLGLEDEIIPRELSHTLQQIWNPRGAQNGSVSLISELFAVCRDQLYILLSHKGALKDAVKGQTLSNTASSKSITGLKRKQALDAESKTKMQESVGSKLHNALAKVANKLMPSSTILPLLLEYCDSDNVELVQNALHVLRCILRHDSLCRDEVLPRKNLGSPSVSKQGGISESFSRLNFTYEGTGWFIPSDYTRQEKNSVPVFSSPRVFCGVSKLPNETTKGSVGPEQIEHQRNVDGEEDPSLRHCIDGADIASLDPSPFLNWLRKMAAHPSNLGISFEATATIALLVAHSEPVAERAQFGFLLWNHDRSVAPLLKKAAGLRVQLQAIRLVHLLLHCPTLLRIFCSALDTSYGGCVCSPKSGGTHTPGLEVQGKGECKVVLDGVLSTLEDSGSSLQDYVLRRDAIRLLTYLASSGDAAIRILLHAQIKWDQSVPFKESNNSLEGGNALQSENLQEGSRMNTGTGDVVAPRADKEKCFDILCKLISLLARELRAEEDEAMKGGLGVEEDRASLIREALTLFSKLLSNQSYSREVLDYIVASTETTRLVLGVIDELISRGSPARRGSSSSTDVVELARGLQKRILLELAP